MRGRFVQGVREGRKGTHIAAAKGRGAKKTGQNREGEARLLLHTECKLINPPETERKEHVGAEKGTEGGGVEDTRRVHCHIREGVGKSKKKHLFSGKKAQALPPISSKRQERGKTRKEECRVQKPATCAVKAAGEEGKRVSEKRTL